MRCSRKSLPGNGCLDRVHGGVEAHEDGIMAATGGGSILQISHEGDVVAARRTQLGRNHLMEFTLDSRGGPAYAVGQCYYTGGVSVLELASEQTHILSRDVCGERIAVGDQLIAVAEQARANPLGIPSRVALVDTRAGSTSYVTVPAETLDLLVLPPD
jgi:hypothetical protein